MSNSRLGAAGPGCAVNGQFRRERRILVAETELDAIQQALLVR